MWKHLVSVIIPCYNAERWIAEAIESVLSQSYSPIEVIVIDDGSTDRSLEIIKNYGDKVKWQAGPNRGGNFARNLGFRLSNGEYIQYLDADDKITQNKIAHQVRALKGSNADVAFGDWKELRHEDDKVIEGKPIQPKIGDDLLISLITDCWCPHSAYLFRRGIIEKTKGWNEDLKAIQDVDFITDIALAGGQFLYVQGLTGYYRRYGNVTTSTKDPYLFNLGCYLVAKKIDAYWSNNHLLTEDRKNAIIKVYSQVSRFFFACDRALFFKILDRLNELSGKFIPKEPRKLALLSRLIGYPGAEQVALWYRNLKKWFKKFPMAIR